VLRGARTDDQIKQPGLFGTARKLQTQSGDVPLSAGALSSRRQDVVLPQHKQQTTNAALV
jgi:hypothetical protein